MERVTANDVKAIMDNCPLEDDVIEVYIHAASRLVTDVFSGVTVSDGRLKEIERYYTAHMITSTRFRMASTEQVGQAQITYTGKWGEGLLGTPYGQIVMQLDTTGKVGKLGKPSASIIAIKSFEE